MTAKDCYSLMEGCSSIYNALQKNVITIIIIIWLGIHYDSGTVLCYCGHVTACLVQIHQMVGC